MRKPAFCIWENKDAAQLCGNCTTDQLLCFCYIDSAIPLLPTSDILSLYRSYKVVSDLVGVPEDVFSHDQALHYSRLRNLF